MSASHGFRAKELRALAFRLAHARTVDKDDRAFAVACVLELERVVERRDLEGAGQLVLVSDLPF